MRWVGRVVGVAGLLVGLLVLIPATASATTGSPSAPSSVTAQPGDHQATVLWTVAQDNGSPLTGYQVSYSVGMVNDPGLRTWSAPMAVSASSTSLTITGLTNGSYYVFEVTASNANGTGPATDGGGVVPSGLPIGPSGATATGYNRYADIDWSAANPNGAAITGYTVTTSPGGITVKTSGDVTYATVPGLTNGTRYTITVRATNANGDSATTAQTSVTPMVRTRVAISGAHPYFMGTRHYYPVRVYVKTDRGWGGYPTASPPGYVVLTVTGAPGVTRTYRVVANNTGGVVVDIALSGKQGVLTIKATYTGARGYLAAPPYAFDPTIYRS